MAEDCWYNSEATAALAHFQVTEQGLDEPEVQRRLQQYGPNALPVRPRRHWLLLFLNQFRDFMIMVLIAAGVLCGLVAVWVPDFRRRARYTSVRLALSPAAQGTDWSDSCLPE